MQLRTTAELAAALQLIETVPAGTLVLTDGTMSLPFVQREKQSLFFEHLRRYLLRARPGARRHLRGALEVARTPLRRAD